MKVIQRAFKKRKAGRVTLDLGGEDEERQRRKLKRIKQTLAKLDEQEQEALKITNQKIMIEYQEKEQNEE